MHTSAKILFVGTPLLVSAGDNSFLSPRPTANNNLYPPPHDRRRPIDAIAELSSGSASANPNAPPPPRMGMDFRIANLNPQAEQQANLNLNLNLNHDFLNLMTQNFQMLTGRTVQQQQPRSDLESRARQNDHLDIFEIVRGGLSIEFLDDRIKELSLDSRELVEMRNALRSLMEDEDNVQNLIPYMRDYHLDLIPVSQAPENKYVNAWNLLDRWPLQLQRGRFFMKHFMLNKDFTAVAWYMLNSDAVITPNFQIMQFVKAAMEKKFTYFKHHPFDAYDIMFFSKEISLTYNALEKLKRAEVIVEMVIPTLVKKNDEENEIKALYTVELKHLERRNIQDFQNFQKEVDLQIQYLKQVKKVVSESSIVISKEKLFFFVDQALSNHEKPYNSGIKRETFDQMTDISVEILHSSIFKTLTDAEKRELANKIFIKWGLNGLVNMYVKGSAGVKLGELKSWVYERKI